MSCAGVVVTGALRGTPAGADEQISCVDPVRASIRVLLRRIWRGREDKYPLARPVLVATKDVDKKLRTSVSAGILCDTLSYGDFSCDNFLGFFVDPLD